MTRIPEKSFSEMEPKAIDEDYTSFREFVIHGLRSRGWSRSEAESEADDQVERLRNRTNSQQPSGPSGNL